MGKRNGSRKSSAQVHPSDLSALHELHSDNLKARWNKLFGAPPPARLGRNMMIRAIAYRLQEQASSVLKPATRRHLARVAKGTAVGSAQVLTPKPIKPGTRLIREWQGVVHEVIVMEKGVTYRGATWTSLSAVAREITGARWSGPRFFGLDAGRSRHE